MRVPLLSLASAAASILLLPSSNAASIIWSAAEDNGLALSNATTMLPTGSLVRVGIFTGLNDQQIRDQLRAGNFTAVNDAFTVLGSIMSGQGFNNNPGYFAANSTTQDTGPTGLNIAGQQLYVWAFNAPATANVTPFTEHGIFYMPKSANANWQVPTDLAGIPGSTDIELTDLTGTNPGLLFNEAQIVVGGFSQTPGGFLNSPNFLLEAVPEPSAALAVLVGACGLIARRRRRVG